MYWIKITNLIDDPDTQALTCCLSRQCVYYQRPSRRMPAHLVAKQTPRFPGKLEIRHTRQLVQQELVTFGIALSVHCLLLLCT